MFARGRLGGHGRARGVPESAGKTYKGGRPPKFPHPEHGKAAGADAEFIIKIGPAFGVVLIIATQCPDKRSLPTGCPGTSPRGSVSRSWARSKTT